MRLLTIFFCGPTIVTPTFFRSLVCEGKREGESERKRGRGLEMTHRQKREREKDMTWGKTGREKDSKCVLVMEDVTPT